MGARRPGFPFIGILLVGRVGADRSQTVRHRTIQEFDARFRLRVLDGADRVIQFGEFRFFVLHGVLLFWLCFNPRRLTSFHRR
jgi:hypothetical protein